MGKAGNFLGLVAAALTMSCGAQYPSNNIGYNYATKAVTVNIPLNAAGMGAAAYGANPLHVPIGTMVYWHNADTMGHSATGNNFQFDTGVIPAGGTSMGVPFTKAGTYAYYCTVHGAASMSGVIMVP